MMRVADFSFDLPKSLIAFYPSAERSHSRLLSLDGSTGVVSHGLFTDLLERVNRGDLLVFNNTRVIPARLFGRKESGGKVELLIERILDTCRVLAHIRASRSPTVGSELWLGDSERVAATVVARHDTLFELCFNGVDNILAMLEQEGHIPLPPYIERADEQLDQERYQTVYSKCPGAVAAPTAGLHFDQPLLAALRQKGVELAFVTLHVGAGTFQPVRVEQVQQHVMHAEYVEVLPEVAEAVIACKARGNRVIAVGTTSVRSLESASRQAQESIQPGSTENSLIAPFSGDTRIFIYPGYRFRIVDALITNFHLPESTLLMLVCAFAGYEYTMAAYGEAVRQGYRFFSYGDAMFITHGINNTSEMS